MAREGVLPKWLSHTNSWSRAPFNATATVAAVSTIVAIIIGFGYGSAALGGDAWTVYDLAATIGTLAIVVVYIALCLGGIAFFKKTSPRFNPLTHGLIPLVGVVIFAAAWYGSVKPAPPAPINSAAFIAIIWFVIGLIVLAILSTRNRAAIERIGTILGEEGGDVDEFLSAPLPSTSSGA
jgi:amino acid transporter